MRACILFFLHILNRTPQTEVHAKNKLQVNRVAGKQGCTKYFLAGNRDALITKKNTQYDFTEKVTHSKGENRWTDDIFDKMVSKMCNAKNKGY